MSELYSTPAIPSVPCYFSVVCVVTLPRGGNAALSLRMSDPVVLNPGCKLELRKSFKKKYQCVDSTK